MTTNMVSGQVKNGKQSPDTKMVMLGATGVGKSAVVVRYLTKRFIWEYDPTLECNYKHSTTIDDESVVLEILDTAGQENAAHLEGNMRWGDGFLLVYSVIERQTFDQVRLLKQRLDELRKARNVSCVIMGNKTDLQYGREVSVEEGESLATELGCAFYETSACDGGSNIHLAFHELYREVRRRRLLEGKTRRRSSAQQVKQVLNKVFTKIQNS